MREIKFKAKDKQTGEWKYFTIEGLINSNYYFEELDNWRQFTGLTDKNGVEIYEGDKLQGRFNGEIKWNNEKAMYNDGWCDLWKESEIVDNN